MERIKFVRLIVRTHHLFLFFIQSLLRACTATSRTVSSSLRLMNGCLDIAEALLDGLVLPLISH